MITFPSYFFVFHVTSKQDTEWLNFFNQKIVKQIFFSCFAGEWKVFSFYFFVAYFFNQDLKLYFFYKTTHSRKVIEKKKLEKREETNLEMALLNPCSSLLMPILFYLSHSHAIIKMRKSTEMAIFFCVESQKKKQMKIVFILFLF